MLLRTSSITFLIAVIKLPGDSNLRGKQLCWLSVYTDTVPHGREGVVAVTSRQLGRGSGTPYLFIFMPLSKKQREDRK